MVNPTTSTPLLNREAELLRAHPELDDGACTAVEGLDRAACGGHITDLARLAIKAANGGRSSQDWRAWIQDALDDADVANVTEECMRTNGLWPWSR